MSRAQADVYTRLRERQEARVSALEQKRSQEQGGKREEETSEFFIQQLEARKNAITSLLSEADSVAKAELPVHFEKISSECQNIQKLVSDSTVFLTSWDLKTSQKQIKDLLQLVNSKQDKLLPPKKFSFASRSKKATPKPEAEDKVQSAEVGPGKDLSVCLADMSSKVIAEKQGVVLEMRSEEVRGQDLHLSTLERCEIRLFGAPSSLHMTNLTGCTVLCGPVSGSVFVEHCNDCVMVVPCQQLRVHSTSSSHFYLHVTSRAIIEDSQKLTFAPYSWTYPEIEDDYKSAGLDKSVNNWDKVDDFNWLASREPSPNWSVQPEDKRATFSP